MAGGACYNTQNVSSKKYRKISVKIVSMTKDINQNRNVPKFLKVLCILSFIMCGLYILSHIFKSIYSVVPSLIGENLIITLISLTGVILMWRLKKIGYFIYILSKTFIYIIFINIISKHGSGHGFVYVILIPLIPFDIAFMVMYATQLKHMTWKLTSVEADARK
jgi:hypothetical protein